MRTMDLPANRSVSAGAGPDIDEVMAQIRAQVAQRRGLRRVERDPSGLARYQIGTDLLFRQGGNADPFLGHGWSHAEPEQRWIEGHVADLRFAIASAPSELLVFFDVIPLLCDDVRSQEVTACWNGRPIGHWSIDRPGRYCTLAFLGEAPAHLSANLSFRIPNAFAPADKGLGPDRRKIGLAFQRLVMQPTPELGFQ